MFDSIIQVLSAFWHQDFTALMAPGSAGLVYFVVAVIIFLESGFIPAAPFPCDSVVVLSGTLAAVGVLDPIMIMLVIAVSAGLGSWAAYLQGKWLNRLPKVQGWVSAGLVYFVVAVIIFLESGFIPAAPFPCDSVVVLSGTLAAVSVLDPIMIIDRKSVV